MLIVKSIFKVLAQLIGITVLIAALIAAFVAAAWIFTIVVYWLDVLLATVLGVGAWEAAKTFIGNAFLWLLGLLCLAGIVTLFALEVRDEYLKEKRLKEAGFR